MSTPAKTTTWFRHPISKIIGLVQDDKYCTKAKSLMTCVLFGKIMSFRCALSVGKTRSSYWCGKYLEACD